MFGVSKRIVSNSMLGSGFYYDESLLLLRREGFKRHARSPEIFNCVFEGLEKKLIDSSSKGLYREIILSDSEWVNMAFERQNNDLLVFFDPEGLVWDGFLYRKNQFGYSSCLKFDISGKASMQKIPANNFSDTFLTAIFGRKYEHFPSVMKDKKNGAYVELSPNGAIFPVCLSGEPEFKFSLSGYSQKNSSRGIRLATGVETYDLHYDDTENFTSSTIDLMKKLDPANFFK